MLIKVTKVQTFRELSFAGESTQAKGRYVIVTLAVKNVGDKAIEFGLDRLMLMDKDGILFRPQVFAANYIDMRVYPFCDVIAVLETATCNIVYDISSNAGSRYVLMPLHIKDNPMSPSVIVSIP